MNVEQLLVRELIRKTEVFGEADSNSAGQKLITFSGTLSLITVFSTRHWKLC
jgi:hypothetical protein